MLTINSIQSNQYNTTRFTNKTEPHSSVLLSTTTETKRSPSLNNLKANFLPFSSLKDTNAIGFNGSIMSCYDDKDIDKMRTLIEKCKYVKDIDSLLDSKDFKVVCKSDRVILKNIRQASTTGKKAYIGVADDLSRHIINLFTKMTEHKEFNNKYIFKLVSGNDNSYFHEGWEHHYILCWPKSKDSKIRHKLDKHPTEFPKGVLLIDPSSHTIGFPRKEIAGYKLNRSTTKISSDDILTYNHGATNVTVLGTMENLNPEHLEKKAIVCLGFTKEIENQPPKVELYIQREAYDDCIFWINWRNEIKHNSPLMKLVNKVESDIQKQFKD